MWGPGREGALHEEAECFVGLYPKGVHHLVKSGVQPKGGAPISAIEAQTWAHISRQMEAGRKIKGGSEVEENTTFSFVS
jgi:hypothetical protein